MNYKNRKSTTRVILHDSHTTPEILQVEDVPRWAELARDGARQMGLLDIGYHVIIERDGTRIICRDLEVIGSHTPGHNMDSLGVCLVGGREGVDLGPFDDFQQPVTANHAVDNFTEAQRLDFLHFMYEVEQRWSGIELVGHSEVQSYRNKKLPPCPPIDMDLLRDDVKLFREGYLV